MIRVRELSKAYGGVQALQGVSLDLYDGEIHALCGENGAGKSTLIKVLAGVVAPDAGTVHVGDAELPLGRVNASEAAGIAVIHQESTVFPDLNAVDNVFVGRERRNGVGLLDYRTMRRQTAEVLERLGQSFDIDCPVSALPLAQRQMVAMARALSRECHTLILDEPTASLSARETERLLGIVRQLKAEGLSILYVSHRLNEVFLLGDRVTVLRDGRVVDTLPVAETNQDDVIRKMVGGALRELTTRAAGRSEPGDVVLAVDDLCSAGRFSGISLRVRAGEVLGLGGLVGAGRSEVARAIFGIDGYDRGTVALCGQSMPPGSLVRCIAAGMALVPEDRQGEGLILPMRVSENLSLAALPRLTRRGLVDRTREREVVDTQMRGMRVKASSPAAPAETLSGGNQQKLVIGKWLATDPRLLILDEPTRGVDVGAKAEVHHLVAELAQRGAAILLISSDMPELLTLSDRIMVLREGSIAGELSGAEATEEAVLRLALPDAREESADG